MATKTKNIIIFSAIILLSGLFIACSTKKNTGLSRGYQGFATKYNVKFNAQNQYDDGIKALRAANQDDYSAILPMFPVVNKETGGAISSQMNITVEKCRKAIKLHSIRTKPTKKPVGMSDEKYREFRVQEEFNPQIKTAWLLLGKAEFHKADFIGAVGDFNYLIRHFSQATATVCEAKLWVAHSYAEMDWLYEAENTLQNIDENSIPNSLNGTFAAFKADILLKQKRYKEAIPFLSVAVKHEKDKYLLARFEFILGQLYELSGQNALATEHFLKAKSKAQSYEMLFNAELRANEAEKNSAKAIKNLQKMAKNSNNKNYLDQIYYAVGNQYLKSSNEPKAIENYQKAMELSTRNGLEKALVALKLADLFYAKQDYIASAPYFDSVVKLMPNTHIEYKRSEKSAEILGELVQNYNTVQLQDSLLHLSTMSETEQLKIIDKIIVDLIEQEKQAAKDSADRAALAVAKGFDRADGFEPLPGTATSAEWYFYNSSLVSRGKREFDNKWGRRILEDNWRRTNKVSTQTFSMASGDLAENDTTSTENDTIITDKHDPAYYLAQIPKTDEQKNFALSQIATALYNMGGIFLIKLQDDPKADGTYREFQRRFGADDRKCETYYYVYQISGRANKDDEKVVFRDKIITEFPQSKYAAMLIDPNYAAKMAQFIQIQDSIYAATYSAYTSGNFNIVNENYDKMAQNFPLSELMPKFAFLHSLVIGKTGSRDDFEVSLNGLLEKFPESDVAPMSRDILALMLQGREKSTEISTQSLNDLRDKETKAEIEEIKKSVGNFSANTSENHNLLIISNISNRTLINNILYDIAAYNFNKFLIKDFDFDIRKIENKDILIISGMETEEEAKWYKNLLFTDNSFAGKESLKDFSVIIISDSDLQIIGEGRSLEEYIKFSRGKK